MTDSASTDYLESERKLYSLYVLQHRALPAISDGLKAAARRVLWTARDGKKYKTATLAGATMPIHPHGEPSSTINTLAAPYGNNIPLLEGIGSFGTLTSPTGYGAARYTSVKISEFANDVLFKDIEIIPMIKNYDETLDEPLHFLPLIPLVLLNPTDGIAIGFATSILPRSLEDIVKEQIKFLSKKNYKVEDKPITFYPTKSQSHNRIENSWHFRGKYEITNSSTIVVTELPYGVEHEKYISSLIKLIENDERVLDYVDDTTNQFNIKIKLKRGILDGLLEDDIFKLLNLNNKISENMNVINFDCESVLSTSFSEIVEKFTEWRLQWYVKRYERLVEIAKEEIQRYLDIILAIDSNVGGLAKKISSKKELVDFLKALGIINVEYIASLPIYRFIEEEKKKVEEKLGGVEKELKQYVGLLKSEEKRKEIYIEELEQILKKYRRK